MKVQITPNMQMMAVYFMTMATDKQHHKGGNVNNEENIVK